jgi:hypothetical protein
MNLLYLLMEKKKKKEKKKEFKTGGVWKISSMDILIHK